MIRIGIFFGGKSREREVSFAGGRTVYDNLDKTLFTPVPIFVDSNNQFILLDWQYLYKGTIRDFYPPVSAYQADPLFAKLPLQFYVESMGQIPAEQYDAYMRQIGQPLQPGDFCQHMDVAFLALHGPYGEDGNLQGMLEWYGIPYTGAGILSSAIGIDKNVQKSLMRQAGFRSPKSTLITKDTWLKHADPAQLASNLTQLIGLPIVVKALSQGSSIGVSIIQSNDATLPAAIDKALFLQRIKREAWALLSAQQQLDYVRRLTDIREGIGLPVQVRKGQHQGMILYHPAQVLQYLQADWEGEVLLESIEGESSVLFESFIHGTEFSCIVVAGLDGQPIALPPTQIVKQSQLFDYRSKYLPGMSRKVTPIDLPEPQIQAIMHECKDLFSKLHFGVYARIDGFINDKAEIFLNDPNTTSGMLPSSFFFHQAAEIGLNPSQFLTFIIYASLQERLKAGKSQVSLRKWLGSLTSAIAAQQAQQATKTRVAVIMGGFSSERHISVESGRNIFEKLASSPKYQPVPIFLTGSLGKHELYTLPINILLKDNADDIKAKVTSFYKPHPVITAIQEEAIQITQMFGGAAGDKPRKIHYKDLPDMVDAVFIALHGRPGEDGEVQKHLEKLGLPYNGSGINSSATTINKYNTNEILAGNGILVASHTLVQQADWKADKEATIAAVESGFPYPLIAKPADDGCSSAVKKINNRHELTAFAELIFREYKNLDPAHAATLHLHPSEEFPHKDYFMVETLIAKGEAEQFLEITGGMLTHYNEDGSIRYEMFEPSEALASGEILSLEEKFLAGEGQNITPPRYSADPAEQTRISSEVKATLERTACLLDVEGYCRIDAFVRIYADGRVETVIIEINSLPGMTPATAIFHQCALAGYKPYQFIDAILTYGQARTQRSRTLA